ncbi:MAG: T9SS type A sorting domain-containing protein [Bacteroidetes bacterium]|nr:T9SS type A sorting domain-containing protein [Bacteroidota bacterium]
MKHLSTIIMFNLLVLIGAISSLSAQQVYYYDFRNTLDENSAQGPTLNVLGTGAFVNEGLTELSCLTRPVYGFTQNSGVQFDNTVANNFITGSFSVEMYFQFLINSGYMRIIDFKNQTSELGVYSSPVDLLFYDVLAINTTQFVANQYVHFVLTRDSVSQEVILYADGAFAGSFVDSTGLALLDSSNVMNFFQDDGGEARPGRIALLKLYDYTIDSNAVASNFNDLLTTSATLSFDSDISSACLAGNVFNFTNTSLNAGGVNYTYDFGDGTTVPGPNATYSYLADGNYTVQLFADDGAGCVDSVALNVLVYQQPPFSLASDSIICDGDSLDLDAGTGFTTYLWSDSTSNQILTVGATGSYSVIVTDQNGCSATDSIDVTVILAPLVALGPDTTLCFGSSLIIAAPAGEASYLWSTGDTTETITVTAPGVYAVQVANTTGCSASDTIDVFFNAPLVIALGADTALCQGDTLTLDAGAGFSSYLWSDASLLQTLSVSASGTYFVDVVDSLGCTANDTIEIIINPLPVVDLGNDTTFCGGTTFTLDGGAGFVNYLWNDGTQTQTIAIVTSGTYSLIVTDLNGCAGTDAVVVNATPLVDLGPDLVQCEGTIVTLDAGPGLPFYFWSDGTSGQTIDVTLSGNYSVSVSDLTGCVNSDEITVTFNPIPVFTLGLDQTICDGATAILDPGAGFFAYLWNDGSTLPTLSATNAGTYIVTVSSAPNCNATDTIEVFVNPAPIINLGNNVTLCEGVVYTLDAGSGFSAYLWNDGSSNQTLDVTLNGTYSVVVFDALGCSSTDSVDVNFNAVPVIELGPDQSICGGTSVILDAGLGFANYLWSDGSINSFLLVTTTDTYSVTVTNFAGCSSIDSVTVNVIAAPVVAFGADTSLCDGFQLVLDAGTGFSSYLWNDTTTLQTLTVSAAGTYSVIVTDSIGCIGTDEIIVGYYAPVTTPTITQNVNILQSSPASSYQWYEVPGGLIAGATSQTYAPGQNGTFYVVVIDSNGCQSQQSADYIFLFNGIADLPGVSFQISPNPANQTVLIESTGVQGNAITIQLMDMLGQSVFNQKIGTNEKFRMDVSAFAEGIYFVRISGAGFSSTQKLVISR